MADKKPIIDYNGKLKEIATGDKIPIANLATGTPDGTKYIRDDGTLVTPPTITNYVDLTTSQVVGGNKTFTGQTAFYNTLNVSKNNTNNLITFEPSVNGVGPFMRFFYGGTIDAYIQTTPPVGIGSQATSGGFRFNAAGTSVNLGLVANDIGLTNGLVAIGSTSTDSKLHISSVATKAQFISFREDGVADKGVIGYPGGSGDLVFKYGGQDLAGGTEQMRLAYPGNLGIGTPSPTEKLHINGNIIASAPTYTTGSYTNLVRNTTSGRIESFGSNRTIVSYTINNQADLSLSGPGAQVQIGVGDLSANSVLNMTSLNQDMDYMEILFEDTTYTLTFSGQTVYTINGVTVITAINIGDFIQIRRIKGKLRRIN